MRSQAAGWTIQSPDVATVGDFTAVNLEAVMALDPDFVIMTSGTGGRGGDSSQADLRDALVGAGIPVAYFEVTTFDDYERLMRTFTDITGRADLYDQNVAKVAAGHRRRCGRGAGREPADGAFAHHVLRRHPRAELRHPDRGHAGRPRREQPRRRESQAS